MYVGMHVWPHGDVRLKGWKCQYCVTDYITPSPHSSSSPPSSPPLTFLPPPPPLPLLCIRSYLLNPYSILTCGGFSTVSLSTLTVAWAIWMKLRGKHTCTVTYVPGPWSGKFVAVTGRFESHSYSSHWTFYCFCTNVCFLPVTAT